MKKYKTLFIVLLTILSLTFIAFVVIMQQQFKNPEFDDLPAPETTVETDTEEQETDTEAAAGAASSVVNGTTDDAEEADSNEEDEEATVSRRSVIAETLNVRKGPGPDYEMVGILILDQIVEVEDNGEEWVKVTVDDITGYVNEKYLSEEE